MSKHKEWCFCLWAAKEPRGQITFRCVKRWDGGDVSSFKVMNRLWGPAEIIRSGMWVIGNGSLHPFICHFLLWTFYTHAHKNSPIKQGRIKREVFIFFFFCWSESQHLFYSHCGECFQVKPHSPPHFRARPLHELSLIAAAKYGASNFERQGLICCKHCMKKQKTIKQQKTHKGNGSESISLTIFCLNESHIRSKTERHHLKSVRWSWNWLQIWRGMMT